jgi:DNA mismatch repair protein MutL
MIPTDSFPMYVLFIDLDPTQVDVNVHPTKQEIKFEDEKIVYAFVQAAVKHALAQFSITPTLDFDLDSSIQQLDSVQKPFTEDQQSATKSSSIFQTFTQANQAHKIESSGLKHWSDLGQPSALSPQPSADPEFVSLGRKFLDFEGLTTSPSHYSPASSYGETIADSRLPIHESRFSLDDTKLTQLFNTYILVPQPQGFLLVHQQSAHERVIYERLIAALQGKPVATQRSLFPASIELAPADAVLLTELLPDLQQMGYTIEPFGKTAFVIQGTPADVGTGNEKRVLEKILEQYKHFNSDLKLSKREMLLRTVAWQQAIKAGVSLMEREMRGLIEDLFACQQPNTTPSGRPTYMEFKKEQLEKMFGR